MKERINKRQVAGMNLMYKWYSFDYFLDTMEELGFESISIWGGPPHFSCDYLSYSDCKELNKKIKDHNLTTIGFLVTSSSDRFQSAVLDKEYYEKAFLYYKNGINACAQLGSKYMSCNSGWGYNFEDREEAWKRSRDMLSRLSEEAKKNDVILTMESLKSRETNLVVTLEDAKRMFKEVNHTNFKLMADTGAIYLNGETLESWFETFGDDIQSLHFVDTNHVIWGDGNIPLENLIKILSKYGYENAISLEVTSDKYFKNPKEADRQNMKILSQFF